MSKPRVNKAPIKQQRTPSESGLDTYMFTYGFAHTFRYYCTHFESLYKDTPKLAKPAQHHTRMGRMENRALELFGNPKELLFSPLGRHNSAAAKMWRGAEWQEAMPTTTANMHSRFFICWASFALGSPTAPWFRLKVPTFPF